MANNFLPAKLNLPIWRGATFRYGFQWINDNGKEKKPQNLTGFTGEAILQTDTGEEVILSTSNGGVIFGGLQQMEPPNGFVELYMKASFTKEIEWKKASYALIATEPSAPKDEFPLLTGQFHVSGPPL